MFKIQWKTGNVTVAASIDEAHQQISSQYPDVVYLNKENQTVNQPELALIQSNGMSMAWPNQQAADTRQRHLAVATILKG